MSEDKIEIFDRLKISMREKDDEKIYWPLSEMEKQAELVCWGWGTVNHELSFEL